MTKKEFTVIDIFAAPGGLLLGFKMAGFRSLVGMDIDEKGMLTYQRNFPETKVLAGEDGDVREEKNRCQLAGTAGISKEGVDVIVGGPPCQGFSTIGRVKIASLIREGTWKLSNSHPRFIDDPRNVLYRHFVEIVKDLQPRFFVMENVPGMRSYRNGEIVREIKEDFRTIGYEASWIEVLNALWYGAPQNRKRIFFVGTKEQKVEFGWPEIKFFYYGSLEKVPKNIPISEHIQPCRTVKDAMGDLPAPLPPSAKSDETEYTAPGRDISEYARLMRGPDPTGEVPCVLYNHVSRYINERDRKVFTSEKFKEGMWWRELPEEFKKLYGYRGDIFHDKIKRLHRNKPSWTVVAHLYKDGYMYVHPIQPRTITVREAARLQSFPDWFRFMGSRTDQYKQVGNAVPPLLAEAVAIEVRKALEKAFF